MQLTACIQIYRHIYSTNFNNAATYLSTNIAQIFPDSHPGSHARRGHGQPNICRHNVAKAQTKNGNTIFNGDDINHTERYFPAKEWSQLGPQGQKSPNDCPKRKAKKEALMSRNKSKVSSASTQNGKQNDLLAQQQTLAVAEINGVMQASTSVADDDALCNRDSASTRARMPQIGTHATRTSSAVKNLASPNYYHHRNFYHERLPSIFV